MSSDSIGLFIFIKLYMEELITKFGDKGLEAVSAVFLPSVGVMVSIWVMLEGYRILNGQSREPITALFWKGGKVVLITTIAGWIMGNTGEIRDWFNANIKDAITTVIAGEQYRSPESMVDATLIIMQMVMAAFGEMNAVISPEHNGSLSHFISMSGISQGAPAVVAGSLLLLNQVAISLSLMTAPAFILCLLYEPTKGYFQGWLKFTLSALLTLAVLTAMVTISLKIVLVYSSAVLAKYSVATALKASTEGIAQTTMMQGGLGLMMSTLMVTVPPMAAGLLSGAMSGFMAHNALDGSNRKTDSNGNVISSNTQVSRENTQIQENSKSDIGSTNGLPKSAPSRDMDTVKANENSTRGAASQGGNYSSVSNYRIGDDSAATKQLRAQSGN